MARKSKCMLIVRRRRRYLPIADMAEVIDCPKCKGTGVKFSKQRVKDDLARPEMNIFKLLVDSTGQPIVAVRCDVCNGVGIINAKVDPDEFFEATKK